MTVSAPGILDQSLVARDPRQRALLSRGTSNHHIYQMIARYLRTKREGGGKLLDVGCGSGALRAFVQPLVDHYVGLDLIRYDSFPADCEFYITNFDSDALPLPEAFADIVVASEIVEHLENPQALMRKLARVVKPGGWVLVTTPNQLSLLSLLTLITKHRFAAFQDVNYPAHLTALLEIDLRRMASEIGLVDVAVEWSLSGRIPKTSWHYPGLLTRLWPRALSDNLLLVGKRPSP
jgi:SAM-dependent methyltransferase